MNKDKPVILPLTIEEFIRCGKAWFEHQQTTLFKITDTDLKMLIDNYHDQQDSNDRMKQALLDIMQHIKLIGGGFHQYSAIYNMCLNGLGETK
jgi:hypothetical protein